MKIAYYGASLKRAARFLLAADQRGVERTKPFYVLFAW